MKNRAAKKRAEELALVTFMHFPDLLKTMSIMGIEKAVATLSCKDCEDYKCKVCAGEYRKGTAVIDCMIDKLKEEQEIFYFI